jgi:hypothetical protein
VRKNKEALFHFEEARKVREYYCFAGAGRQRHNGPSLTIFVGLVNSLQRVVLVGAQTEHE